MVFTLFTEVPFLLQNEALASAWQAMTNTQIRP